MVKTKFSLIWNSPSETSGSVYPLDTKVTDNYGVDLNYNHPEDEGALGTPLSWYSMHSRYIIAYKNQMKISAIKLLRRFTECNLRDAK